MLPQQREREVQDIVVLTTVERVLLVLGTEFGEKRKGLVFSLSILVRGDY